MIDDSRVSRGLAELNIFSPSCQISCVANLRHAGDRNWVAGLSASILLAFSWIRANTDADFILRIDADALAIGPFASQISSFIAEHPDAGVIGTVGLSCNPDVRARQDLRVESKILRAYRLWPQAQLDVQDISMEPIEIPGFAQPVTMEERRAFDRLRPHVEQAIRQGFASSEYCQGGACVITRRMVDRMAARGYLDDPEVWLSLRVPDDVILAMYARAVGLRLYDYSHPGEPFGVQHRGLPYSPEELIRRGYSLIHSVKNDSRYSELAIREFFRVRAANASAESSAQHS